MRQLKISKQITNRESQSLDKYLLVDKKQITIARYEDKRGSQIVLFAADLYFCNGLRAQPFERRLSCTLNFSKMD